MGRIFLCLWREHDLTALLLALLLCSISISGMFLLMLRSRECVANRRRSWIAIAAATGGTGVWATHFIAMLGYRRPVTLAFDPAITALSILCCIACFWLALHRLRRRGLWVRAGSALLCAAGVATMHALGMIAIVTPMTSRYDRPALAWTAAIATALFFAALTLFAKPGGRRRLIAASATAVLAVCWLHFGAMAATTIQPYPGVPGGGVRGDDHVLTAIVAFISLALVMVVLAAAFFDRLLTDLRGLADSTLEGLAIVRDGAIADANGPFVALTGLTREELIGERIDRWLQPLDERPLLARRDAPFESLILGGGDDRIAEVAVHRIEYRGRPCDVLAVRDLTERKRALDEIAYLAEHDALTGLANRNSLHAALKAAEKRQDEPFALLALDLDRFKAVNDLFGHAAGDETLCRVADILRAAVQPGDLVARMGGDEFVILQGNGPQPEAATALVGRIARGFAAAMDVARDPAAVGVSIGVSLMPHEATTGDQLRQNADVALYRAKSAGRGTACFFDRQMDEEVRARRALEQDLRHTLLRDQIYLAYQPLVRTDTGEIAGYEALVRWRHPERGEIAPGEFVPIAEDTGFIIQLGEWVIREACRAAASWPDHITLAVNVSAVQFQVNTLPEIVRSAIEDSGFDPLRLEIEITETALMRDRDAVLATLHRLRAFGVRIAMDDFGTGYSSLSNLQAFPFDKIKIDRSFVSLMNDDAAARSIIRAIVGLGRSLNLPVVAEGVETEAQRRMVLEEGCPQAQGYLFGRPTPFVPARTSPPPRRLRRAV